MIDEESLRRLLTEFTDIAESHKMHLALLSDTIIIQDKEIRYMRKQLAALQARFN